MEAQMTNTFTLQQCMAAACAAQRINGKYVRRDDSTEEFPANNWLTINILKENSDKVMDVDQENSRMVITYLEHKLPELIAETLQDYWRNAVLLTDKRDIGIEDYRTFAFLASVPGSVYNACTREQVAESLAKQVENSRCIGTVGKEFPRTQVTIIGSVYSRNYFKHYHTAYTADGDVIRFPLSEQLDTGSQPTIAGRIHKHDGNMTVLHYVRVKKTVDTSK
jgi:hypothetical protein